MAGAPTAVDYVKAWVNPGKILPDVAAPLSALFGDIPWSGVPQIWSEVASQPTSQMYQSWLSGQMTADQANAFRRQQAEQLKKAGATPAQIQAADRKLVGYINTPVNKGGAGGVTHGWLDALTHAIPGSLWAVLAALLAVTVVIVVSD